MMNSATSKITPLIFLAVLLLIVLTLFSNQDNRLLPTAEANTHPYLITDASENYIVINDLGFTPLTMGIEVGEAVTWHNATQTTHVLVSGLPLQDTNIYLPLIVNGQTNTQLDRATLLAMLNESDTSLSQLEPADTIMLAPGEDVTLTFEELGTYDYYLETAVQFTNQIVVSERANTTIERTSPAAGEGQVSVARETIIEFSHPLEPASVTTNAIYAQFGGQVLAATLHLSPDQKKVTLFYNEPLPASARVRLTINGDQLRDDQGNMIDADGNGAAGGTARIDFDTLGITVIPGTSVCGTVYASELGEDASGNTVDVPLEGATITVDGMEETLFTLTDAAGNFCLDPAPAGRFFVHIDGRTASNNVPAGAYYPYVGKAWESVVGRETDVGVAHLPLVVDGTLQAVSETEETTIYLPEAVTNEQPAFADVAIQVPAGSLFADDGTRGGQVGIAPVPPDRLPGTLPENLNFPLVITVQTDGATNFDTPAPVCFPNLPDPDTDETLPPGAKSALMSFNHDSGRWELAGSMTVSDDGTLVCSDPGVGILAPGWHGESPLPFESPDRCDSDNAFDTRCSADTADNNQLSSQVAAPLIDFLTFCRNFTCLGEDICRSVCNFNARSCADRTREYFQSANQICENYTDGGEASACAQRAAVRVDRMSRQCESEAMTCQDGCDALCPSAYKVSGLEDGSHVVYDNPDQVRQFIDNAVALTEPYVSSGTDIPTNVLTQVYNLLDQADDAAGGDASSYLQDEIRAVEEDILPLAIEAERVPPYSIHYMAEAIIGSELLTLRGKTASDGQLSLFLPRASKLQFVSFYDPLTSSYGRVIPYLLPNARLTLPRLVMQDIDDTFVDRDNDGIADLVEDVYGTDFQNPDTDEDGIPDGAEIEQGTNPLDGLPVQTGVIASADTPGTAVDVCALNDVAIVADGEAGLSVFDVSDNQNPIAIAQVDTPGTAARVTCALDVVAVADGLGGLAIVDITDPPAASITHQLALGEVKAVTAAAGIAYAGAADGTITAVTLQDGVIITQANIGEPVLDVQLGQDVLYVYAKGNLYTLDLANGLAVIDNEAMVGTYAADEIRPLRLFVGDEIAYATHRKGYNTFDLTDPANPTLVANGDTTQFGWRQIVANGSGLGLATVGPNSTNDGPHNVSLYDVRDAAQTDQFLTEFETPGLATAISIYNGLAYVADGEAGFQVINYLAYDAQGVPPTITAETNAVGDTIEEGQTLYFAAQVSDDVQVRNVEFYIDGERAITDGNFPFAYRSITPLISQQPTMTLQAKATDTGGNVTWSTPLTLNIVPDMTPPQVGFVSPAAGASLYNTAEPVTAVSVIFNEPIDPATVTADSFQLFAAGSDEMIGTEDDVPVISGTLAYEPTLNMALLTFAQPLPVEQYQLVLADMLTDLAGNGLTPFSLQFQVTSGAFGEWNLSRAIAFNNPQAAHYNPVNGLIYVGRLGTNDDGVYRIEADDSVTQVAAGDDVAAVAIDPSSGHIFFTEGFEGILYRVEITATERTQWVAGFHAGDDDPVGIAFAPADYSGPIITAGDGLVVDRGFGGDDEVWRFSPDVPEGETVVHDDDGTLVDSADLAISSTNVYVIDDKDADDGVIYRLNADGSLAAITTTQSLPAPQGVTIDPTTGNLLIQDSSLNQILSVNLLTGAVVDILPGFSFDLPSGSSWAGIDISPDGQLLIISDKGPDLIYVFTRAE